MCGIVGLLLKKNDLRQSLGQLVTPMLICMGTRGSDSAGLAVFHEPLDNRVRRFGLFSRQPGFDWQTFHDQFQQETGSEGTIRCPGFGDEFEVAAAGDKDFKTIRVPEDNQRDWSPEADLVRAIREGGTVKPSPTYEDGFEYMNFVEGVARSSASGQALKLPLE